MTDHATRAKELEHNIFIAILKVCNTAFDCGAWNHDEGGEYSDRVKASESAKEELKRLIAVALTRAAEEERERCAVVAETMADAYTTDRCVETKELSIVCEEECRKIANEIRWGKPAQ